MRITPFSSIKVSPLATLAGVLMLTGLAFAVVGCQPAAQKAPETNNSTEEDNSSKPDSEAPSEKTEVKWASGFDAALAQAKTENKMVFVKFTAEWCGPCHRMDDEALTDNVIVTDLEKMAVPIHIDIDDPANKELCQQFLLTKNNPQGSIPYAVMMTPDKTVKADMLGYGGKDSFHKWLRQPGLSS